MFVSILACIAVGLAVAVPAFYLPGQQSQSNGGISSSLVFTNERSIGLVNVSGDVHVNVTGSWGASSPTWQTWGYNPPFPVGVFACYPYCGNSSIGGAINYSSDFCTSWLGGGTSYANGRNVTLLIVFATGPIVPDFVSFHVESDITPSDACDLPVNSP